MIYLSWITVVKNVVKTPVFVNMCYLKDQLQSLDKWNTCAIAVL